MVHRVFQLWLGGAVLLGCTSLQDRAFESGAVSTLIPNAPPRDAGSGGTPSIAVPVPTAEVPECDGGCAPAVVCGDGLTQPGEACDQGGVTADCRGDCSLSICPESCSCGAHAGRGFAICLSPLSFDESVAFCQDSGGVLVRIHDFVEQRWLLANARNGGHFWIGASDAEQEGSWRWQDESLFWEGDASGILVGAHASWREGQPDAIEDEDCAEIFMTPLGGEWYDRLCSQTYNFICEFDRITSPSCGDSVVDELETCDEGANAASCDWDCTAPRCGDGVINATAGEECDDNNADPFDACDETCTRTGLLAWWPLDDIDSAYLRNPASDVDFRVGATIPFGGGRAFDGSGGLSLRLARSSAQINVGDGVSISMRAQLATAQDGLRHLFVQGMSGAESHRFVAVEGTSLVAGHVANGTMEVVSAPVDSWLGDAVWHHIVAAYDGSSWTLFADGEVLGQVSTTVTLEPLGEALGLGGFPDAELGFAGAIADVRVYDHALGADYVRRLSALGVRAR